MRLDNRLIKLELIARKNKTTEQPMTREEFREELLKWHMDNEYEFLKHTIELIEKGDTIKLNNINEYVANYKDYHDEEAEEVGEKYINLIRQQRQTFVKDILLGELEFYKELVEAFKNDIRFSTHEWTRTYFRFLRKIPDYMFNGKMELNQQIKQEIRKMQLEAGIEEEHLIKL